MFTRLFGFFKLAAQLDQPLGRVAGPQCCIEPRQEIALLAFFGFGSVDGKAGGLAICKGSGAPLQCVVAPLPVLGQLLGKLSGLLQLMLSWGFFAAQWIGFGCFHVDTDFQCTYQC